jgi:hypothetical protein
MFKLNFLFKNILAKMVVTSELFYAKFSETFPNKKTLGEEKIDEIKEFLIDQSNENPETRKINAVQRNWLSRYYLRQIGETFYVFHSSNDRRMVSFFKLSQLF